MKKERRQIKEAARLENLWQGPFGDEYVDRNRAAAANREPFWSRVLAQYKPESVLEVGCNVGANLCWIAKHVTPQRVYGVDINLKALRELKQAMPEVNAVWGPARELPFRDRYFDLVFTMGVLIHQPESSLRDVMSEVVRCAKELVLCGEYFAESTVEVPYRGQSGALFKRNYGRLYQEWFPELQLLEKGFLTREQGWDDVTFWIFRRGGAR